MLTQAQFLVQVRRVNWHYEWIKTSSLHSLVNAIQTYNTTPTDANLLVVYQRINALPPLKKAKYAQALAALMQSMPVAYFQPPANLNTVNTGIGIPRGNNTPLHQADVVAAVFQLSGFAAGQFVLTTICNQITLTGNRVGIQEWDMQATNKCAVMGLNQDNAKSTIAYAVEFNHGQVGAAITASLAQAGHGGGHAWLATQMCACPIYDLMGLPIIAASDTVHGVNWITPLMITNWVNGTAVFPAPLVGQPADDVRVVLVAALRNGLVSKGGQPSVVRWNASSTTFTDTTGVVQNRPAYISLAHELVHAYHNISGDQAGHEIGTYSRVLYEYQCMGLGPWAGDAMTENAVRLGNGLLARACY